MACGLLVIACGVLPGGVAADEDGWLIIDEEALVEGTGQRCSLPENAGAWRRQKAANTAGQDRRCFSCTRPLASRQIARGGALDGAADAVQVDESLTDLAAPAEDLDRDEQAVPAL
jgi:hypothetical protein